LIVPTNRYPARDLNRTPFTTRPAPRAMPMDLFRDGESVGSAPNPRGDGSELRLRAIAALSHSVIAGSSPSGPLREAPIHSRVAQEPVLSAAPSIIPA